MNAGIYKLIFSKRLNALVVVGEICSSQGKAPGTTRALKRSARGMVQIVKILGMFSSGALLVSSAWATTAPDALPTGGQVAQGSASISQSGAQMDINQASQRAVINWQTFDVGSNARVHIIQQNATSVLLNRVVTNKPSEIYGKIDANGQVILVNANGIIFGQDGSASASSFTATTLDISDKDFMEGKTRFSSNGAQGEIVNHGTIEAKDGGYVALLGAKVTNDGKIITHNGTVALGAADSIAIPMTSSGKIKMELSAGSINAAVENTKNGVIVTEGGDVYLQAAAANHAMASITNSGQIDTSGEQAGKAVLLADNGEIKVDGSITANSSNAANKGGDIIIGRDAQTGVLAKATDVSGARLESKKGFVETSGDYLATDGITVKAAQWLLDPSDITISSAADSLITGAPVSITPNGVAGTTSNVKVDTIQNAINAGTNVTIQTTNAGNATGAGNITIANALAFKNTGATDATLSLIADNGIIQNAGATITTDLVNSTKLVNVSMTAKGNFQGVDAANANSKGITLNSTITTNGNVTLNGTNQNTGGGRNNSGVVFNSGSGITAKEIYVKGTQKRPGTTDANGIAFNGSTTFNSSGASIFEGISSSIGNASAGVYVEDGATLNLNSGAGSMHFKGDNTNAGYRGIRLGFVSPTTTNVNTNGNVIFGTDANAKQTFLRANLNVNSGSVTLQGSEVQFYDGAVLTAKNATTVNLTGKTINLGQAGSSVIKKDTGGFSLNMTGDTVMIQNTASVDAGTGTVAVKTLTSGREIQLGADDVVASKMGLTNAELGLIKAGQVVIGDTSSNGAIHVAGATSTNATTGNITLQTGGNIYVNDALTIAAGKTLTLNGAGASSTISQADNFAGITADKVEFLGNTATVSLQPANSINKIGMLAGKVKSFALFNERDLTVGTVNSTVGLTATDNIYLLSTTLTGTALSIASKIESTAGNVRLSAFTSDTASVPNAAVKSWAEVKGKDVTMNAVAQGASGYTLGYYGAGIGGKFTASGDLNLSGSSKNIGNGFYMYGGALSAGNALTISGTSSAGQGVGFDVVGASSVSIISNNGVAITGTASTAGKDAIGLNGVTLNNAAGAIKLDARAGNINTSSVTNTLTQNGNGDVTLTTVGNGNITVPKIINNGTGNVIIAAGSDLLAGNGGGGQVKTVSGNTIAQGNALPGKTYIYSGSATATGTLSNLDSANLADLYLDSSSSDGAGGFIKQNAESNVAFMTGATRTTIASGAPAQVMFREKVSVNLQDELNGATFNSTYGDANTKNGQSAALWGDVQGAMKDANKTGGVINQLTSTMKDANHNDVKFHVSAATVIDSMTGNIPVADAHYSNADYLKANAANGNTGYVYNIPASNGKYTVAFVSGDEGKVKVDVAQKAVSYNGVSVDSKVYDGTTNAVVHGAPTLLTGGSNATDSKVMTNDKVALGGAVTGQYDTKNVRGTDGIGTNNVTLSDVTLVAGVGGDDSANYKFNDKQAVIDGNNTITVKTVTYSGVDVGTKVYDADTNANLTGVAVLSTIGAGLGNANDNKVIADDNVALDTANLKGTYDSKNVRGTDGAGANNVTLSGAALVAGVAGDDTTNYNFVQQATLNGKGTITPKDASVVTDGKTVVYNGSQQTDTITKKGFIDGDKVGTAVGAGAGTELGSYAPNLQLVGDISDLDNYNVIFGNAKFVITDAAGGDSLLNPVPVNPNYQTPGATGVNELVTTQQNNEQIQKQCSLEFAKECKVQPATVQEIAPKYVTFY